MSFSCAFYHDFSVCRLNRVAPALCELSWKNYPENNNHNTSFLHLIVFFVLEFWWEVLAVNVSLQHGKYLTFFTYSIVRHHSSAPENIGSFIDPLLITRTAKTDLQKKSADNFRLLKSTGHEFSRLQMEVK